MRMFATWQNRCQSMRGRKKIKAWKRIPAEIRRNEQGDFEEEPYVTLTQAENTNSDPLYASHIRIDESLTAYR